MAIPEFLAHDGDFERAALLLGFVDAGFDSWEDGRQATEARQRERAIALLEAGGMPAEQQATLPVQGGALSMFQSKYSLAWSARLPKK